MIGEIFVKLVGNIFENAFGNNSLVPSSCLAKYFKLKVPLINLLTGSIETIAKFPPESAGASSFIVEHKPVRITGYIAHKI